MKYIVKERYYGFEVAEYDYSNAYVIGTFDNEKDAFQFMHDYCNSADFDRNNYDVFMQKEN